MKTNYRQQTYNDSVKNTETTLEDLGGVNEGFGMPISGDTIAIMKQEKAGDKDE